MNRKQIASMYHHFEAPDDVESIVVRSTFKHKDTEFLMEIASKKGFSSEEDKELNISLWFKSDNSPHREEFDFLITAREAAGLSILMAQAAEIAKNGWDETQA